MEATSDAGRAGATGSPRPAPLLRVRDLVKSFRLHGVDGRVIEALRGVDLSVEQGSHVSLAGPSGAGKSTVLRCVHRTYLSDSGQILYRPAAGPAGDHPDGGDGDAPVTDLTRLGDQDMADLREADMGYVSQFLRAEPRRGVLDVVTRAARRRGAPEAQAAEAARRILRRLGLEERLFGVYPSLLSGGEKQRVNLAAGIVVVPRLLLLDEPVSALDPANKESVLDVIAELTGQGATVLSVFHDLDAMASVADRVIELAEGRVRS